MLDVEASIKTLLNNQCSLFSRPVTKIISKDEKDVTEKCFVYRHLKCHSYKVTRNLIEITL